jgi:hypothetical protein
MKRLHGHWQCLYKHGEPTDREALLYLDDLKRAADALHRKITDLPLRVNGLLLSEEPQHRFALAQLLASLALLNNHLIPRAAAKVKPQVVRRRNAVAKRFADTLREVLVAHGVKPTKANLTSCLQFISGIDQRFDRSLK